MLRRPAQTDHVRVGLLGFFATLSVLSLALNGYFLWQTTRYRFVDYLARFRTPAPVSASDHVRGSRTAATTLIVYSDFECPFCKDLHLALKTLAATETFRWVFRHFPLPNHPSALREAEACECAGRQGKFWEFADGLYEAPAEQPPTLRLAPTPPGSFAAAYPNVPQQIPIQKLVERAGSMKLDRERFRECLEAKEETARVLAQKTEGDSLWIRATPTVFLNGRRFVGTKPLEELRKLLRRT